MNPEHLSGEAGRTFAAAPLLGVFLIVAICFCCGAAMWCFGSILLEHYVELYRRHKRENKRQPEQPPSQADNLARLAVHPLAGNLRKLRSCDKNLSLQGGDPRLRTMMRGKYLLNLGAAILDPLLKFFGGHGRTPNDQAQRPPPETPGRLQQSRTN
jgi:hypothetical protein